jgi:2-polyprenyl-3-methyl-5-hydroxy-6-metoxy-1,4-benzoquinol methylase
MADTRTDARQATADEVTEIFSIPSAQKNEYWNSLYETQYLEILENPMEIGRHGAICEYISQTKTQGRVLDVGCGTGIISQLLDSARYDYVGIDISDVAIDAARKKNHSKKVKFITSSLEEYKTEEIFDFIILNEMIYYIEYETLIRLLEKLNERGNPHFIVSVFDFQQGLDILEKLKREYGFNFQLKIEQPLKNFVWHLAAFNIPSIHGQLAAQ